MGCKDSIFLDTVARTSFRLLEHVKFRGEERERRAPIYGAGCRGGLMLRECLQNRRLRLKPMGFVDDDLGKVGKSFNGYPVLGEGEEILKVRPGITDLASLRYRNEAELLGQSPNPEEEYIHRILPEKIRLAKEYLQSASLAGDLALIFKTLLKLGNGRVSS